jgi:hypothetical protein
LFSIDSFVHCSLFMRKYSVLILDSIPGILIPLYKNHHHLCKSNKHHTSDCTIFVLVYCTVGASGLYYDHRHRRIYETNILQAIKHAQGETRRYHIQSNYLICVQIFMDLTLIQVAKYCKILLESVRDLCTVDP